MKIKIGTKVRFIWRNESNPGFKCGRTYKGILIQCNDKYATVRTVNAVAYNIPKEDILDTEEPKKKTTVTASDLKLFSDTCFEMAVRFRDNWTSVISGKKGKPRDYAHIHGGHFIGRSNWGTRHCLWNCHAITQGENYAMSRGDTKTITAYYNFLLDKYNPEIVQTLHEMSEKKMKLSIDFLRSECLKCFSWLNVYSNKNGKKELLSRIETWPKSRKEKIENVLKELNL